MCIRDRYTRYVNDDAGNTKLDMTLMSDDSIDVFLNMNDVLLMKRIENGYMYPLDELFEGAGFSLEDDYDENITQKEINGHYYSLPAKRITSTILYLSLIHILITAYNMTVTANLLQP